ncbi:hypothetical protein [Noviherbaspirillum galbum]|uniref:STAS/SEC14 domain-containing protein n=1 Tax=Noviherbaspirillum galbum TaxID=2709383 RepID=A0A6B3SX51_9BURK|nr:hypothetical protein [Noviherbaspirillum galbum]NEX64095.1 hypothetical protein [Noviherbaspirillum galbum]
MLNVLPCRRVDSGLHSSAFPTPGMICDMARQAAARKSGYRRLRWNWLDREGEPDYAARRQPHSNSNVLSHRLSFAEVLFLENGIVETIVDNGIEISRQMLDEWAQFLKKYHPHPPLVLVHKLHSYSYSFAAQLRVGELDFVRAVAVVNASKFSNITSQSVLSMLPFGPPWPVRFFQGRAEALDWLGKYSE